MYGSKNSVKKLKKVWNKELEIYLNNKLSKEKGYHFKNYKF